jgi:polysaccharide pyruvyl transferase WcaK-like protein
MILHVASHGLNIGDGAIISSMQRLMPKPIVDADITLTDKEVLRRKILNADRVVMGGGGGICNSQHNYPTQVPLLAKDIREGMAFAGMGYNQFYESEYVRWEELKDLIQACKDHGVPFAVRADGSKAIIEQGTGLEIDEIPDPGLFVKTDETYRSPCIKRGKKNVIIQLAGDGNRNKVTKTKVFESLVLSAIGMAYKYDANIIFAPHIVYDLHMVHNAFFAIREKHGDDLRDRIAVAPVVHPREAAKFFRMYEQADLVVGMRGHSVICGVGLGTPTVAIDSHPKVVGFMEHMGLSEYVYRWQDGFYQLGELIENPEKYPNLTERVWNEEYPKFRDFMKGACHGESKADDVRAVGSP